MRRKVLIVLAAGASTRMGTPKALLPAGGGRTFLGQIAHRARKAGLRVLVVTGAHAKEIARAHPELEQVVNRRWRSGQWSSVKAGLKAVSGPALIQPVDAPNVSIATYAKLAASRAPAAYVTFRSEPGHPVRVDAATALRARVSTLAEALGALDAVALPVRDRHVLENFNVPRDLRP
jgi:CTP:molybdopterin cytidylyltransferase MocA